MSHSIETLVPRAAAWLDEAYPDWHKKVNPSKLNMFFGVNCVGGQIGVHWKTLAAEFADARGVGIGSAEHVFADFTELWKVEVVVRQTAPADEPAEKTYTVTELRELKNSGKLDELLTERKPFTTQLSKQEADWLYSQLSGNAHGATKRLMRELSAHRQEFS